MKAFINFKISHQTIYRADNFKPVAGSRNYLYAQFEFSEEWDGLIKTAIFSEDGKEPIKMILDADNTCLVPWEWLEGPGSKTVSVFGGDLITVNTAPVTVYASGYSEGVEPKDPTPSEYEQIIALLQEMQVGPEEIQAAVDAYIKEHGIQVAPATARVEMTAEDTAAELQPNRLYVFPEMTELSLSFAPPDNVTVVNEYHLIFQSGAAATVLTLPETVKAGDLTVDANKIYELSVLENCLTYQSWDVEVML